MDPNQLLCHNLFEKFRNDLVEALTAKIGREQEEKYKKLFEGQLVEEKQKYQEELKRMRSQMNELKAKMRKSGLVEESSDADKVNVSLPSEESSTSLLVKDEDIPLILQPKNNLYMQKIINHLDPKSFLNLVQTSSVLYSDAMVGFLRVPMKLDLLTFKLDKSLYIGEPEKKLVFCLNDCPLNHIQLRLLSEKKCFRPKLRVLSVTQFINSGEKMFHLLDFVGVKEIFTAEINTEIDVNRFIKNFKVGELRLNWIRNAAFLQSPELNKIKQLIVHFESDSDVKADVYSFFTTTSHPYVEISGSPMPVGLVYHLVEAWLNYQEKFNHLFFDVDGNFYTDLRKTLICKFPELQTSEEVRLLPLENVKEKINPLVPTVVSGHDTSLIVIRGDGEALKIDDYIGSAYIFKIDEGYYKRHPEEMLM